jgi:hypothetical protein
MTVEPIELFLDRPLARRAIEFAQLLRIRNPVHRRLLSQSADSMHEPRRGRKAPPRLFGFAGETGILIDRQVMAWSGR